MGNLLNEQKPAEKTYSEAEVRAFQAEQAARMLAEQNRQLQAQARFGAMAPAPRPAGPDPLMVYAQNNLTQTPEENARQLDAATRARAAEAAVAALNQARRENAAAREADKNENALNMLVASNPDIAADQEGYAAALAKAEFRAMQRGVPLDGPGMVREALGIYRKEKGARADAPVLEGSSRADAGGMPIRQQTAPKGKSHYEELYGMAPGEELHEEAPNYEEMTQEYADAKNSYLEGLGVGLSVSQIRNVQGENMQRSARKAKKGVAA